MLLLALRASIAMGRYHTCVDVLKATQYVFAILELAAVHINPADPVAAGEDGGTDVESVCREPFVG
jgi:hypothetical protein